jgi:hypothetical protein
VDYDTAQQIFTKLVREKKAKGYTEGAYGTPYRHTDKRASGILPQLLNPIEEADVERLLCDDDYCAQEKHDGRHILIRKRDGDIEGINKKGLLVGLPQTVSHDLRKLPGSFVPDGERAHPAGERQLSIRRTHRRCSSPTIPPQRDDPEHRRIDRLRSSAVKFCALACAGA